jgi:hypothetical protein
MAIITVNSDLLSTTPVGSRNNPANRQNAVLCTCRWALPALIAAADIGSTFRICMLPANGRLLLGLSKLVYTAGGSSAAIGMGYEAFRGPAGEVIPAAPTYFGSALSIVTAGRQFLDSLTSPVEEYDIPTPLVVTMTVAGANLPIGFAMNGVMGYSAACIG